MITDNVKSLQCDRCQNNQWKCIDCLNLSGYVYDQLITDPACCLKWYCDSSEQTISVTDMDSVSTAVTSSVNAVMEKCTDTFKDMFRELQRNILQQLSVLEMNLGKTVSVDEVQKICDTMQSAADVRDCVEGALKSQLEEEKYEEIEKRKTSVIVHDIAESTAETPDESVDDDLLQVAAMLQELKAPEVKVEKVIRLGRRPPDNNSGRPDSDNEDAAPHKHRPMKVILDSEENKI